MVVFHRGAESDQAVFVGNQQSAGSVRAEVYLHVRHRVTVLVDEVQDIGFRLRDCRLFVIHVFPPDVRIIFTGHFDILFHILFRLKQIHCQSIIFHGDAGT